jgi:hypothetical protein
MQRVSGNWVELSKNSLVSDYKLGDLSSSFVVKKKDNWYFQVVLDFETKQLDFKSCYNRECSGRIIMKHSRKCS